MTDILILKNLFQQLVREEKRGRKFFSEAAKFVSNPQAKRLFEYLSIEEGTHVDMLRALWKRIGDGATKKQLHIQGTRAEVIEYMGSSHPVFILDEKPFSEHNFPKLELFKPDEFQTLIQEATLDTILKYAMSIEFENSRYIVGFMKQIKNPEYRKILTKLADEEKEHFIALKKLYEGLKKAKKK